MLIVPAIHISHGRCTRTADGEKGTEGLYPYDPVQVARMWRGENAKALHVVGLDFQDAGISCARELLHAMVEAVDIPIQVAGGLDTLDDVRTALEDIGLYRVVISTERAQDGPFLDALLREYGPRKIVVEAQVCDEDILSETRNDRAHEGCMAFAEWAADKGVQRVVINDRRSIGQSLDPPADFLHSLVERTNLSVTLNGSVRHHEDLRFIQELHPRKIDSIILDEALYSNAFPCQKIWRKAEQQLIAQQRLL